MKLYTIPISPNCRRVEATIHHLGLDVEIYTADMMGGELKSDEFLALNPNGRVPLLIDGDFNLWESNVIMQYLAHKNGADGFYPSDFVLRTDIHRWQSWECLHFNRAAGGICWETIAKPAMNLGEPDDAAIQSAIEMFHQFAKVLNTHLEATPFIMGEAVTLADFSVGSHSALVLHPNSQVPLDDYPNIGDWYRSLEKTPAWAKTAASF